MAAVAPALFQSGGQGVEVVGQPGSVARVLVNPVADGPDRFDRGVPAQASGQVSDHRVLGLRRSQLPPVDLELLSSQPPVG